MTTSCPAYFRFILLVAPLGCASQNFMNMAPWLGIDHSYNGVDGGGAAVCDWNDDGWDDIALASNGICKFYENTGEGFVLINSFIPESYHVKQISMVDFDNDGDPDLFISCYLQPFRLLENIGNAQFPSFIDISAEAGLPQTSVRNFGHAWSDFDRDGWLDLYVSTYAVSQDAKNFMFRNNGNGTFSEMATLLGIDDGYAMTLQPVFCDFNNDFFPDLFLANDKLFPNKLYINNQGTSFVDVSVQSGLNVIIDAMSATAGDFDNDGWDDIYTTNNQNGNKLHHNSGNLTFSDATQTAGVAANVFCWGAQWIDGDNDGFKDLFVASDLTGIPGEDYRNKYFKNNGNGSFQNTFTTPFTTVPFRSFSPALGDFNNDGYADILLNNHFPSQSQVWYNQQYGNHFLKVKLKGQISNADAIGSRITVQSNDLVLSHFTKCGEAYLAQNSNTNTFGLGANDTVQSIHVVWPSGFSESFYNLKADTTYVLKEGQSLGISVLLHTPDVDCHPPGSVFLTTDNAGPVHWSSGTSSDTLFVTQSGWYSASATFFQGLTVTSDSVYIHYQPDFSVWVSHASPLCYGQNDGWAQVNIVESSESLTVAWSTGDSGQLVEGLGEGVHSVVVTGASGCQKELSFALVAPEPLLADIQITNASAIDVEGQVKLNLSGGTPPYTVFWPGGQSGQTIASFLPGDYGVWVADAHNCMAYVSFQIGTDVGISESHNCADKGMWLAQNPCNVCILDFCHGDPLARVDIYEISGRLIESFNLTERDTHLRINRFFEGLPVSLYLVNYQATNLNETIKVLKTP